MNTRQAVIVIFAAALTASSTVDAQLIDRKKLKFESNWRRLCFVCVDSPPVTA
jgi:hypothetical protein